MLLDYGYFNIFQFINPYSRDKLVKWLRDEVAAVRRDYPGSPVSLVAHSLGTFLVARLIEEETAFSFDTVLFSGSIVNTDYDWSKYLDSYRVKYVANYMAKKDIWPALASYIVKGAGRAGVDGFESTHVSLFQHLHSKYGHSDYFNPHTFKELWLPKLVIPQRQVIETLSGLLVQAKTLLKTSPESGDCHVRVRMFYNAGDTTFRQFPGMHAATSKEVRYSEEELDYALTRESALGAVATCPPTFQAAFTTTPTEWSALDESQPTNGRGDLIAAVSARLFSISQPDAPAIGMVALEVLEAGDHNHAKQAVGAKPLVPKLSEYVVTACVGIQALFPEN
ncbi:MULTISPECIES: hypothetical protein [unclassified Pseudomonas]|uniref:hypothetical protein n=1 Tax=unclassified Pseudomonas TaxID=196821 RepID=UPI0015A171AC|nr:MULTISPECIES: hypothetical protein [unclassified Pseudomonas]MEE5127961.1 hypothetical protein [Pseudomonas alliivorans]NWC94123.1 hypothetical protein [Pseudomonas sp. IPO3779]NWD16281.1 hypothetical protein [Pseudomonas sp. IPO3778]